MTVIVLALCGMFVYSDIRVAIYISIGYLLAKSMINALKK